MSAIDGHVARTLVIPVYRNAENIPDLVEALANMAGVFGSDFEIIFVVDGSPDNSGDLLVEARKRLPCRTKIAFHSRNFGSFAAIRTGLELAEGKHIAAMAADLQEPPELIERFFEILGKDEADVVFGQRVGRADSPLYTAASNLFWWIYRKLVLADIPKGGVDLFACNRRIRDEVLNISEPNSSLIAQLFWVGFRRAYVPYKRLERTQGRSAWSLTKRVRYMMDSIFSFTDIPILLVLWAGVGGCLLAFVLGLITLVARLIGAIEEPGFASLYIIVLFFGSAMLAAQGIIGSYLWRTFENTKRRPLRIIARLVSD
jgi:glycosyltransferase involved in cell wall biosynthesis